jgi:hypothetical protein
MMLALLAALRDVMWVRVSRSVVRVGMILSCGMSVAPMLVLLVQWVMAVVVLRRNLQKKEKK